MTSVELLSWSAAQKRLDGEIESILIGNGASIAIWSKFAYPSLFDAAVSGETAHPLSAEGRVLFDKFGTTNFEQVLSPLLSTITVLRALGEDVVRLEAMYASVRESLIAAVHHLHVGWDPVSEEVLGKIAEALNQYKYVFSTNYDLLVYWAMMRGNQDASEDVFKDYFWNSDAEATTRFDPSNISVWSAQTRVLFLHGALHLVRTISGETHKLCNTDGATILARFGEEVLKDSVPLLVSEGDQRGKMASIDQTGYLTFALSEFSKRTGNLVIFGHTLGPSDEHLVRAIDQGPHWNRRRIAVSIYPESEVADRARMRGMRSALPEAELFFFDSRTHPLGGSDLKAQPDALRPR